MGGFLRRHTTTMVVAMVTAAVTAGGPALADGVRHALFAHNADKVDGKHAVGAGASNRSGKLVATNSSGRLPNNIIAKAPDSSRLGGLAPDEFLSASGKAVDAELLDGFDADAFVKADTGPFVRAVTYRREATSGFGTLLGDGSYSHGVSCLPGDRMLSGGPASLHVNSTVVESFPSSTTTWTARIRRGGVEDIWTVVILCTDQ